LFTFFSASQLFKCKQAYTDLHHKRVKFKSIDKIGIDKPFDSLYHRDEIRETLDFQAKFLNTIKVKLPQELGIVDWLSDERMAVFVKLKKKPQWFGTNRNQKVYLNPFEALFLLESESIIINYHNIPLSLEDAYNLLLQTRQEMEEYRIFSYLSRLGFRLKLHQLSSSTCSTHLKDSSQFEFTSKECNISDYSSQALNVQTSSDLITYSLQNDMFLDPQFDKPKDWKEFKGIRRKENQTENKFKATVVDANCVLSSSHPLPNQSLINDNLKPIIDQTKLINIEQLYTQLKATSCKSSRDLISCDERLNISFDVYLPSKSITPTALPDFYLIICKEKFPFPFLKHFIQLDEEAQERVSLIFAVVSETEFNFFWIKPFNCWDEIPNLWSN